MAQQILSYYCIVRSNFFFFQTKLGCRCSHGLGCICSHGPNRCLGFGPLEVGFVPFGFFDWYLANRGIGSGTGHWIFLVFVRNLMQFSLFLLVFVTI